jgi:hypothetical protein
LNLVGQGQTGQADIGDHLGAGLGASRHHRHFRNDVADPSVDQNHVGRPEATGAEEAVDLSCDGRGEWVASGVRRACNAGIAPGIAEAARRHGVKGQAVIGCNQRAPDVDAAVIHGIAKAVLAQIAETIAKADEPGWLEGRLDCSGAAGGEHA